MLIRTRRSRRARPIAAASLALGLAAATTIALAAGAQAATAKGAIYAPNGMVGVEEEIAILAPGLKGQTATIGLSSGALATTMPVAISASGWGNVSWVPQAAGTWTISGLGSAVSSGTDVVSIAAVPTYTVLLAQNSIQQGVSNSLSAAVVSPIGTIAPTGTVYLSNTVGNGFTTQPLSGSFGTGTSTVVLPWTPSSGGTVPIQASFTPSNGSFTASTSPVSQPFVTTALTTVALRWPANLFAGTPTVIQAVLGNGVPDGSVAFSMDGTGISGSVPTVNGVGSYQWTPPASGNHTIAVSYTGNPVAGQAGLQSGTSSQAVNILPPRVADNITVDPPSQPVWNIAQPITMRAGTNATLVGTATSGTTVLFGEQGTCVISGNVLSALSAGQCQVTASSAGNASLKPGTETYTVTITAAPKKS